MATGAGKELPSLSGHKFKTRKRDEKVKYDAADFCEKVIGGLNGTGGGLEEIYKYLDQAGSSLDYR